MTVAAQILIVVAVLFHVMAFVLESLLFSRPGVRSRFGVSAQSAAAVRPWAFNQGFYNLFLAAGPASGLIAYHTGHLTAGHALALYGCAFMAACGAVLLLTDRRMWPGALGQSAPPALALIALLA